MLCGGRHDPKGKRYLGMLNTQGFTGTLPNITYCEESTSLTRRSASQEPGIFRITCLARSTAARPATGTFSREARGALTTAEIGGTVPTDCGSESSFTSDGDPSQF